MCRHDTDVRFLTTNAPGACRRAGPLAFLLALASAMAYGQAPVANSALTNPQLTVSAPQLTVSSGGATAWKRVAGTTINLGLAGPASGPVVAIWYAAGSGLLVQTESARV